MGITLILLLAICFKISHKDELTPDFQVSENVFKIIHLNVYIWKEVMYN